MTAEILLTSVVALLCGYFAGHANGQHQTLKAVQTITATIAAAAMAGDKEP